MTVKATYKSLFFCVMLLLAAMPMAGQVKKESAPVNTTAAPAKQSADKKSSTDTIKKERSIASKAALRSAIIPGWGQAYNKKYWKIPIVYGALAIPVATFVYNKKWYDKTRYAYNIRFYNDTSTVSDLPLDNIDPRLLPLSSQSLRLYRNEFRKNMDFSVLAFILLWGLNVADAAVDGHLKSFNINDDLSLKIHPGYSPIANTNGLSLILEIGKYSPQRATVSR